MYNGVVVNLCRLLIIPEWEGVAFEVKPSLRILKINFFGDNILSRHQTFWVLMELHFDILTQEFLDLLVSEWRIIISFK